MSVQKHGIAISCEHCKHLSSDGGGFDIAVPVRCGAATGTAQLHCSVSSERHRIDFVGWVDGPRPPESAQTFQHEVAEVLGFIAEQRLCGNERICPMQVVQLVGQYAATRGSRRPRSA